MGNESGSPGPPQALLADVDRAVFAAAFVDRLRSVGLAVSIHSCERFADALGRARPTERSALYWISRVCLIHDAAHLDLFDRVFDVVFEGGALPVGREARKSGRQPPPAVFDAHQHRLAARNQAPDATGGVPWSSNPSVAAETDPSNDDTVALPELLPAELAAIADEPFDQLSDDELAAIGAWLDQAIVGWPLRRVRRLSPGARGRHVDLRRTLAKARRTGGEAAELVLVSPRRRPRKVVMIADVSGSMQSFVRPYLHVLRSLATRVGAETFAFSTSLTRITPALRQGDPVVAVEAASELVDDRFSGTRIAASLATLVGHSSWSTMLRGSTVLIASDGWDTDPPAELGRRMERLSRMAHSIVWINPRAAAERYQPLVGGMAAALPHCDVMLAGHTLAAMRDVLLAIPRN